MNLTDIFDDGLIDLPDLHHHADPGIKERVQELEALTVRQELGNWCWAATAVSVHNVINKQDTGKSQCEVANDVVGSLDCCNNKEACDQTQYLEDALVAVGHLADTHKGSIDKLRIREEVGQDLPVCACIEWSDTKALHFVTIYDLKGDRLIYHNPSRYWDGGVKDVSFHEFPPKAAWTHTYFLK